MDNLKDKETEKGFIIPDDYFQRLKAEILLKTATKASYSGFVVPDGYFEKLKHNLSDKTRKTKRIRLQDIINISGIAASLILFVWVMHIDNKTSVQQHSYFLSETAIYAHLEWDDLSIDQLCDAGWCNDVYDFYNNESEINNFNIENYENYELLSEIL